VTHWEDEAAEQLERFVHSPMADAFHGTVRILSLSQPTGHAHYQTCTMELQLEAAGMEPETQQTEVVLDRKYWPEVGTVLHARISRSTPRLLEVNWDALAR
jgi:hypothetical protein